MANNYQQSSFSIELRSAEERAWLLTLEERAEVACRAANDGEDPPEGAFEGSVYDEGYWGWNSEFLGDAVYLYSEEGGNTDAMVIAMQEFLQKFRPTEHIMFMWSFTCSKMRPDEFSGGGVVVFADDAKFVHVHDALMAIVKAKGA
jgi:hypothetical protein